MKKVIILFTILAVGALPQSSKEKLTKRRIEPDLLSGRVGFVYLKIYDISENEAIVLVNDYKPAGSYDGEFSAKTDYRVKSVIIRHM